MVPAQPLDGYDLPGPEKPDYAAHRVLCRHISAFGIKEGEPGAALRTSVGLGMKAAGGGIFVFLPAGAAHREGGHGGVWPVVGNSGDDGVAGTAVGAVYEGIPEAPVGRVKELAQAVGADEGVG